MEDEIRYVPNTEGCDVHFNENKEELIPVNLMLTKQDIKLLSEILFRDYKSRGQGVGTKRAQVYGILNQLSLLRLTINL